MVEQFAQIERFGGTDNVSDLTKISISGKKAYMRELLNVDIDDDGLAHRRKGYAETPIVTGTDIHSFWSDGTSGLFVDGTSFKILKQDGSVSTLITGLIPGDRVSYVKVSDRIYFSNNSVVGYVLNNTSYPFPDPAQTFKARMVGGHILEYFNSRLYAANGSNLFYSDATVLTRIDMRKNAIAMPGRITMVKAVSDGLYVSADNKTWFLSGLDPESFRSIQVLDVSGVEGSAISLDGDTLADGSYGKTVYFLTSIGPQKGFPGGVVKEMQGGLFAPPYAIDYATSILRFQNGYQQYLAVCQISAGIGGTEGTFVSPVLQSN